MPTRPDELRQLLRLQDHPEGGAFAETYRAAARVCIEGEATHYPASTLIYYMLRAREFSAMHRIAHDEAWHFYEGDPLRVTMIDPGDGSFSSFVLGRASVGEQRYHAVVPAGCWFGAKLEPGGEFALVGCTVAPGFVFEDFELARREALLAQFPAHRDTILALTRPTKPEPL